MTWVEGSFYLSGTPPLPSSVSGGIFAAVSESVDFDPKFDQKHEFEIYFR